MKLFRSIMVIVVASIMVFSWVGCGSSSSSDEAFKILFNLNATQGPNKNVIEPEEGLTTTPNGNFFELVSGDPVLPYGPAEVKAEGILNLILVATVPQVVIDFLPHNLVLDTLQLGFIMGDIAADPSVPAGQACDQLTTDLDALTGGGCYNLLNCAITSQQKGKATVDFGNVAGCSFAPDWDGAGPLAVSDSIGTIAVRGKILNEQLYPGYQNNCTTPDDSTKCSDIKVAVVSDNFGIFGNEVLTAKSAVVGYVFNYDLELGVPTPLGDLPVFMVANIQMDGENMALAIGIPDGLNNIGKTYFGSVIDADGKIYGVDYPGGAVSQIAIATLPIQEDGGFCVSTFNEGAAGVYTLAAGDECGLCAGGLIIDTNPGGAAPNCPSP